MSIAHSISVYLSTNADIKRNQHRKLDIAGPGQKSQNIGMHCFCSVVLLVVCPVWHLHRWFENKCVSGKREEVDSVWRNHMRPTCVAMFMSLSFETELKTGKFSTAMLDIRWETGKNQITLSWTINSHLKVDVGVSSIPIHASQFDITHKVPEG